MRLSRNLFFGATLFVTSLVFADQSYEVNGLEKPAEIIVDEWGVPHIYVQTH